MWIGKTQVPKGLAGTVVGMAFHGFGRSEYRGLDFRHPYSSCADTFIHGLFSFGSERNEQDCTTGFRHRLRGLIQSQTFHDAQRNITSIKDFCVILHFHLVMVVLMSERNCCLFLSHGK